MILNQIEAPLLPIRINIENTRYTNKKKITYDTQKLVEKTKGSTSHHFPLLVVKDFLGNGGELSTLVQLFSSGGPQRNAFPS